MDTKKGIMNTQFKAFFEIIYILHEIGPNAFVQKRTQVPSGSANSLTVEVSIAVEV